MIFKALEIENIRSYQRDKIEFPLGTSLFEGDIGSGKSTILMAIEFALFGLGNQKGDALLRKGSKKGSVLLKFAVDKNEYQIWRSLVRNENNNSVRQEKGLLGINGKIIHLSPSEIKEKILDILNFKEPLNPRAQSVIFRYAIYTPQEEMKYILSQKPDFRLQTLRKAFGIEDYKIAAENSTMLSRIIKDKISYLSGQTSDLDEKNNYLLRLKESMEINENNLLNFLVKREKIEIGLIKQKEELEKLKESQSELEKIKAEIPHLKRQINDKEQLSSKYINEIQSAEEENQFKFMPEIEKLGRLERPVHDTEENLKNKIDQLKMMVKKRDGLLVNLTLLNENKQAIEIKLGEEKNKGLDDLKIEKEVLISGIEKQTNLVESHQHQLQKILERIYKLEAKKTNIAENLENLDGLGDLCPICGSLLDDEHKKNLKNERTSEIRKINSEIEVLNQVKLKGNQELELLVKDLEHIETGFDNIKILIDKTSELYTIKDKLTAITDNLGNIDKDLALIIEEPVDFHGIDQYVIHLETLLDKLKEFNRSQEDLKTLNYQLKKNVDKIEENRMATHTLKQEIQILKENLSRYEEKTGQIEVILEEIEKFSSEYRNSTLEFESVNEKIISTKTLIKSFKEDITKVEDEITEKVKLRKQLDRLKDYHIWLNDYLIPTLSIIEKHVMQNIHLDFNENFKKWFGLLMDDPSKTGKINEEFTPIIEQDGFEQEINYLSGGEKTSVALAYRLALNNVVKNVSTGMKSNLLILDEPTDGFSKEQLYKVREILNEIDCPQIIIVSHERELESFADNVFRIEKVDGISEVSKIS